MQRETACSQVRGMPNCDALQAQSLWRRVLLRPGVPKRHCPQQRLQCKVPAVAIEEHIGIAVPDYECFWQYQHAVSVRANSAIYIGVMVMSRGRLAEMYGDKATTRTIFRLAMTGKPSLCIAKTFGALK